MKSTTKLLVRTNVPQRRASYRPQVERLEDRLQPSALFSDALGDSLLGASLGDWDGDSLLFGGPTDAAWGKTHRRAQAAISPDMDSLGKEMPLSSPPAAAAGASGNMANHESSSSPGAPLASNLLAPQTAAAHLNLSVPAPSMPAPTPLSGQAVVTPGAPVKQMERALHLVAVPSSSSEPTISPAFTSGSGTLAMSTLIGSGTVDFETSVKLSKAGPFTGDLLVGGYSLAIPGVGYAGSITVVDPVSGSHFTPIDLVGGGGVGISAIDQDAAGNIYVAGDTAALGGGSFIAKIDPTISTVVWAVGFGTAGSHLNGISVNEGPSGSFVYATGSFDSSSFGGHKKDIMAVKMSTSGAVLWDVHDVLPFGESEGHGVVVNDVSPLSGPGGVALAGTLYLGGKPQPLLVMLKDADGSLDFDGGFFHVWYYTPDLGDALAVAKGPDGSLYFTGRWFDHTVMGYNSLLILQWDPDLTTQTWGYYYTSSAIDPLYTAESYGTAIKVDSAGEPYVAGYIDIDDSSTLPHSGPTNCLVAKFSADGGYFGSHLAYGGTLASHIPPTYDVNLGLDLDGLGNAYAVGFTKSPDFPTTDGSVYSGGIGDGHAEKISGL